MLAKTRNWLESLQSYNKAGDLAYTPWQTQQVSGLKTTPAPSTSCSRTSASLDRDRRGTAGSNWTPRFLTHLESKSSFFPHYRPGNQPEDSRIFSPKYWKILTLSYPKRLSESFEWSRKRHLLFLLVL